MQTAPSPAELALCTAGLYHRRMDYIYHERGGTADAALQLGLNEHLIVKSLVFDNASPASGLGVMALIHGDQRVSLRKLERLSGMPRLAPASPQNALQLSGYQPGGICPFSLARPLPVFVANSLLVLDFIYINAGLRGVVLEICPAALLLLGAKPGDFAAVSS